MVNKKKKSIISIISLIFIAILFLLPLLWMFFASFNGNASQSFEIPDRLSLINFKTILGDSHTRRSFSVSLNISIIQTCLVVICSIMAAYPLSRYHLKSAQKITLGLLFFTSIPITALMVPVYQLFISMNLVDSLFGTIIFLTATGIPLWGMDDEEFL